MTAKMVLALAAMSAAFAAFGNAGVFRGGGATPQVTKTSDVQMVEEEVTMVPLRGNYPVDTSVRNLDQMRFYCRFLLRNLTDREITLQVGFPLSGELIRSIESSGGNTTEIAARFGFVAGTRAETFPLRYAPYAAGNKFSNIFLWNMTFAPHEDVELFVSYTMGGYFGVGSTTKPGRMEDMVRKSRSFVVLTEGLMQGHNYITGTGGCWAGKIEKAVFRIYFGDFEEYLDRRGPFELSGNDIARANRKAERASELCTRMRLLTPSDGWEEKRDGRRVRLELALTPFEPAERDYIMLSYVWTAMPRDKAGFDDILCQVREEMDRSWAQRERFMKEDPEGYARRREVLDARKPYDDSVARNLADIVLEFYGVDTGNSDIQDFLDAQMWYPARNPPPLDPELKSYLERKAIPFPEAAWQVFLARKAAEAKP